jgi:hypothetical protein
MSTPELLADVASGNFHTLKLTLADFTDEEMLVRPVPAANHALWQIGHLAVTERQFLAEAAGESAAPPIPTGWADCFSADTVRNDDPTTLPTKQEVLGFFETVRGATAAWVRSLSPADLQRPTSGPMASFAPTVGHLCVLFSVHTAMHLGQFQVIRRKLNKPVLF